MAETFHLGLDRAMLDGATLAIVPGDPGRVERIAALLDDAEPLASQREFTSWKGRLDGTTIVVCSTGIGGPSTSITVEELAQLGVDTFLRVGTTGAIQTNIAVGDLVITTASLRLDGASFHFAPAEFPAVANFACTQALVQAAEQRGAKTHVGVTASSDTFYPGQERYDTFSGRVVQRFRGSLDEWRSMGVLNYAMESATLLTMCASSGLRAGSVAGVLVVRDGQETVDSDVIANVETAAIDVVIDGARRLLS